jgi:predicted nuclease of restriction endonuclease-like (RecB) superfamily
VNRELVLLYWQIGRDILARQAEQGWGAKVIERLAHDLRTAFPDMKGFSRANLMYMRAFAEAWPDAEIVQQAVGQLPWGHNLVLLDPAEAARDSALPTRKRPFQHGWSRNVLNIHIETGLLERTGQAVTNFNERLPAPGSERGSHPKAKLPLGGLCLWGFNRAYFSFKKLSPLPNSSKVPPLFLAWWVLWRGEIAILFFSTSSPRPSNLRWSSKNNHGFAWNCAAHLPPNVCYVVICHE